MNNSSERYLANSINNILNHYFKVIKGEEIPYFKKASFIPAQQSLKLADLWREHERIRKGLLTENELNSYAPELKNLLGLNSADLERLNEKPHFSYLDLKIAIAEKLFNKCIFCERGCEISRNLKTGFCGVNSTKIASEFIHMGEETPLIPSHTIFFTGCTFNCVFCQNMDISQNPDEGMVYNELQMADIIDKRRSEGSLNVNFVGGDPNPHLLYILKTIRLISQNVPVIWNSNFYMSLEAMHLLDGVVDLYLSDFKYGNDECAMRLSGIPDYWKVITRNHKLAWKSGNMIIRHLLLPNHVECCTIPILDWIYGNLGKKAVVNIMAQYRPLYGAPNYTDISRFLYPDEYLKAVNYAKDLGFINLL
jgi:putative pyruvate formate lyase activating enzyme